jgi:3-oxoacyl-[acyl-carrier protein] reductase
MLATDTASKRKARAAEVPLGRVGSPEDVAGAVSFLCGPDSAYVTGTVLHVNGGLWIG